MHNRIIIIASVIICCLNCFCDEIDNLSGFPKVVRLTEELKIDMLGKEWIPYEKNGRSSTLLFQIKNKELAKKIKGNYNVNFFESLARCLIVCDADGDGKIMPNEWPNTKNVKELIRLRFQKNFYAFDRNHNGVLDREERWPRSNSSGEELDLIPEKLLGLGAIMRRCNLFFYYDGATRFTDHVSAVADKDHNGWLNIDERHETTRLSIQEYDKNQDGILDVDELSKMTDDFLLETALWQLCPEVDEDGDQWLSKKEKEIALKKILPIYDVNKDGTLDDWERWMVIRDGWDCWPLENQLNKLAASLKMKKETDLLFTERQRKLFMAAGEKYGTPGRFDLETIFHWGREKDEIHFKKDYPKDTIGLFKCLSSKSSNFNELFNPTWDDKKKWLFCRICG